MTIDHFYGQGLRKMQASIISLPELQLMQYGCVMKAPIFFRSQFKVESSFGYKSLIAVKNAVNQMYELNSAVFNQRHANYFIEFRN